MADDVKRTALEWYSQPCGEAAPNDRMIIEDRGATESGIGRIRTIARVFDHDGPGSAEKHATRIVQACNALPDLVAALRECQTLLADLTTRRDADPSGVAVITFYARCVETEARARAALQKAGGVG